MARKPLNVNQRCWLLIVLIVLCTLCSTQLMAAIPPTSYGSFDVTQRCDDLQQVITSYVDLADRQQCGNQLSTWQLWSNPQTASIKRQWCLKQATETLDALLAQLKTDFFQGTQPIYTEKAFHEARLCLDYITYYSLTEGKSGFFPPWVSEGQTQHKLTPFQPVSKPLAQFIIQAEAQGEFRQRNPLQALHPENEGCQFTGAKAQLSRGNTVQHWLVMPSASCWKQHAALRFWLVEQTAENNFKLLLEDSGDSLFIKPTQTAAYYDLELVSSTDFSLPAGKQLDSYSLAISKALGNPITEGYAHQRFHYNPDTQRYESPDNGTLFLPTWRVFGAE